MGLGSVLLLRFSRGTVSRFGMIKTTLKRRAILLYHTASLCRRHAFASLNRTKKKSIPALLSTIAQVANFNIGR